MQQPTVKELRTAAKEAGMTGVSKLNKENLAKAMNAFGGRQKFRPEIFNFIGEY